MMIMMMMMDGSNKKANIPGFQKRNGISIGSDKYTPISKIG